ncbi:hypothetical protein AA0120_g4215 [Alternaria tenuissima]|nr:hypothetical protein AA0120_g4215 [Alternaria tenuissima]
MAPSANASPLRAKVLSSEVQGLQQSGHTPAFRFIAPTTGQEATTAGPPASTSPTSPSSNQLSPAFSNADTLIKPVSSSPSTFLPLADPEPDTSAIEPNLCANHFLRPVLHSRVPCVRCYSQPQWQKQREYWMNAYREQHPGVTQDIENLSGITAVRERYSA